MKEVLTILSIGLGIFGMYYWTLDASSITATEGLRALHDQGFLVNRLQLFIGIIFQILSLGTMFILSVFKPLGRRTGSS